MPWISNEAGALKTKLSGLTVIDAASPSPGRDVPVYFWDPEYELTDVEFPSIILRHSGISKGDDREHRGTVLLPYVPEQYNTDGTAPSIDPVTGLAITWDTTQDYDPNESPFKVFDYPIPYNLDFQVDVYSRFQTELMPLVEQLGAIDRIPVRFGYIEVPQDATIRSLDLLGGPEIVADKDAEGKRLFRAVYSVRVFSELNLYDVAQITSRISTVNLTLKEIAATS